MTVVTAMDPPASLPSLPEQAPSHSYLDLILLILFSWIHGLVSTIMLKNITFGDGFPYILSEKILSASAGRKVMQFLPPWRPACFIPTFQPRMGHLL